MIRLLVAGIVSTLSIGMGAAVLQEEFQTESQKIVQEVTVTEAAEAPAAAAQEEPQAAPVPANCYNGGYCANHCDGNYDGYCDYCNAVCGSAGWGGHHSGHHGHGGRHCR